MDKGPTLGKMAPTTRANSSKIKATASENKHNKTEFTGATIKMTSAMA
jgi:hypothetical protein